MKRQSFTRREFLAAAGAAGAMGACSSPASSPAQIGGVTAGSVAQLPVGSLEIIGADPVCIGRDSKGAYAMTLICPHAGCDMGQAGVVSPQGVLCACHGSEFDANGNVMRGPATLPLDHFAVTVDASGTLTVNTDEIVPASQRLTV